jgi:guanine deaminase
MKLFVDASFSYRYSTSKPYWFFGFRHTGASVEALLAEFAKMENKNDTMASTNNNTCRNDDDIKWIIHGNFVVPVRRDNIFVDDNDQDDTISYNDDDDCNVLWLGSGRFLKILLDHVMVVNCNGIIVSLSSKAVFIERYNSFDKFDPEIVMKCNLQTEFICPGLIDLHIHAPQYSYTGTATDRSLMGTDGWLETYTFPAERRLGTNTELAKQVYTNVVQTTLQNGTTTAVYFGTLHKQPCQVLVDCAIQNKQRAIIGKVCMDRNSPNDYCHSTEQNIQETIDFIQYVHDKVGVVVRSTSNSNDKHVVLPLVLPMITPRFIPTCTPQLLTQLGTIAKKYNCHITSHISESIDEVEYTHYIDKTNDGGDGIRTDAEIFYSHNLLTNQCIMAHAIYLNNNDIQLLQQTQTGIAHCPLSNFYFAGGSLPCKSLLKQGISIGLGTDVAGGYNPSIFHSMRMAVLASRSLQHTYNFYKQNNDKSIQEQTSNTIIIDDDPSIDYRHAFYMATIGGANVLGLQDSIGTFAIGMEFDALVLSASTSSNSNIHIYDGIDSIADIFQKICVLGDDRNIRNVFVQGHQVI